MRCNVVCIQTYPKLMDKEYNLNRMKELLDQAMKTYPDTELVVFPELATTGYQCGQAFFKLSEKVEKDSDTIKRVSALAKAYNVHIIFGMPEISCEDSTRIHNSQVLIDNLGMVLGSYQKVHLFDSEKQWFTPGSKFKVYNTKIGRIGLFVCYDAFFPEVARILAVQGVDILVNSTNWEKPYDYDMDMVMAARALENTTYLACCNRIGKDTTLDFFGHTRILDPLGRVISEVSGEVEGYTYASLDYEKAANMKNDYYTMLSERRPELYKELVME